MRTSMPHSFRRRLFVAFLAVSLVPLLLCSAMLLQIFRLRMTDAAQAGKTELVVQLSAFEGQSYQVRQAVAQVQAAVGGSGWTTNFYPNADNPGVVEIIMR